MASDSLTPAQEAVARLVTHHDKAAVGGTRLDPVPGDLPPAVRESFGYFAGVGAERDFGTNVYRLDTPAGDLYVVTLVPDGNDGWFEAFTPAGELVGAGQFVMQYVAWAAAAEVRACAAATNSTDATLPALRSGLVWVPQADGSHHSGCGRFHIRPAGNGWALEEVGGEFATLEEAQAVAVSVAPYY